MTFPNPMTREELLENAALDALGLLDEYDAALYTRSVHHAPAAVQDEILQLQGQIVSDESLLPSSELPDPLLRQRVLEAVAGAIEQETAELEPLATIGRRGAMAGAAVQPSLGLSGQFWRAAAFALCACLIIVTYLAFDAYRQSNTVAVYALSKNTDAQLEELIGPTISDYLFDATAKSVVLSRKSSGVTADAAIFLRENSDQAFLVVKGLVTAAQPYTLSIRHPDGRIQPLRKFDSAGRYTSFHVALNRVASQLKNVTWEISGPNGVLLASL